MPPRTPDSVLSPFKPKLGRVPDHLIAQEAGVSRALIIAYRKRLGIPAYQGYKFGYNEGSEGTPRSRAPVSPRPQGFRGRRSALDPYLDVLGKVPDGEVARLAGVTPENVRTYRARRGIEPEWHLRATRSDDAPVADPMSTHAGFEAPRRTTYLLTLEEAGSTTTATLIATGFGDAAAQAAALIAKHRPKASVRAIQRIAELLE